MKWTTPNSSYSEGNTNTKTVKRNVKVEEPKMYIKLVTTSQYFINNR